MLSRDFQEHAAPGQKSRGASGPAPSPDSRASSRPIVSDADGIGSALLTSRALRVNAGGVSDMSKDSLDDFRTKLCLEVREVIGSVVREEVLSNVRMELLRPLFHEISASREAVLREIVEWGGRLKSELETSGSLLEDHLTVVEQKMEALEAHRQDLGLVALSEDPPNLGNEKLSMREAYHDEEKHAPIHESQLAKILDHNQKSQDSLTRILKYHEDLAERHAREEEKSHDSDRQRWPPRGDAHDADQRCSPRGEGKRLSSSSSSMACRDVSPGSENNRATGADRPKIENAHPAHHGRGLGHGERRPEQETPAKKFRGVENMNAEQEARAKKWQESRDTKLSRKLHKRDQVFNARCSGGASKPPDNALSRVVLSSPFSNLTIGLILANSSFIGWEANVKISCALRGVDSPAYLDLVNKCFLILFSAELALRIAALRVSWALGADAHWNWFDAVLVGTSVMQELFAGMNVSFMRIFRVFRIVRVARVFRVVRFFSELRRMMLAIVSCLASLGWAFLLIILIIYVFSIFLVQGCTGYIIDSPDAQVVADLEYWYASLPLTMFSLVLAISGGDDWWTMLEPLVAVSEMYRIIFTIYVLFIVFGVLNVLTGVFTQSACDLSDKDLVIQGEMNRSDQFVREMHTLFREFDEGGQTVNWESFEACMERDDVLAYLGSHQLDCMDAMTLFKLLDTDGQDEVDVNEFIQGCLRLKGTARALDAACIARDIGLINSCLQDLVDDIRA